MMSINLFLDRWIMLCCGVEKQLALTSATPAATFGVIFAFTVFLKPPFVHRFIRLGEISQQWASALRSFLPQIASCSGDKQNARNHAAEFLIVLQSCLRKPT